MLRDFSRMFIRLLMILFLVVGCVQNVCYLNTISESEEFGGSKTYTKPTYKYTEEIEEADYPKEESDSIYKTENYPEYNTSTRTVTSNNY